MGWRLGLSVHDAHYRESVIVQDPLEAWDNEGFSQLRECWAAVPLNPPLKLTTLLSCSGATSIRRIEFTALISRFSLSSVIVSRNAAEIWYRGPGSSGGADRLRCYF